MGCTRIAGSDYPMDTKFMTVSFSKAPLLSEVSEHGKDDE